MNLAKIFIPISQEKKSPGTQGLTQAPHTENFKGSDGIRTLVSTSLELKDFLKVYSSKAC